MGKRQLSNQMCDVLETVWSEPGSPTSLSSGNSMTASVEMNGNETGGQKNSGRTGRQAARSKGRRGQSAGGQLSFFPMDLAEALESLNNAVANGDPDQLFLLPDRVLTMDSLTFREDVASVAPCFITQSYSSNKMSQSLIHSRDYDHNNESNKLLRVLDDTEGLILTRASNGCLWLCDTTTMVGPSQHHVNNGDLGGSGNGVGTLSPIEGSRSPKDTSGGANMMSTSSIFDSPGDDTPSRPSRRQYTNRNRNDPQAMALQREREERVRRLREQQEEERKRKLEELRQHAIAAQKFREQQEMERRRHLDELRYRDEDKRSQVEERRRAIESAERERREALLKKNQEREERIETKRRQQSGQMNFAFGSSTPRILGPRHDSSADIWGGARRSTSSSNVNNQMTQSLYSRRSSERDQPDFNHSVSVVNNNRTTKRATSAHGLNQSGEGEDLMSQSFHAGVSTTAHRKRTDLMPTITASNTPTNSNGGSRAQSRVGGNDGSRPSTPGHKMLGSAKAGRTVSMSRLETLSKPRVTLIPPVPHASNAASPPRTSPSRNRSSPPSSAKRSSPSKSVSMVQLNGPMSGVRRPSDDSGQDNSIRSLKTRSVSNRNAGLSVHHQRSPSAMSTEGGAATPTSSGGVRMRASAGPRRPRPISIATTGVMSSSMYEKGSKAAGSGALTPGSRPSALKLTTPDLLKKRGQTDEEDRLSTSSNLSSSQTKPPRKTPNQVKKESEAKKQAKKSPSSSTPPQFPSSPVKTPKRSTPASSSVVAPTTTVEMSENDASETSNVVENVAAKRELTPDLISSSPVKETSSVEIVVGQDSVANEEACKEEQNEKEEVLVEVERSPSREMSPSEDKKEETATNGEAENESDQSNSTAKKVISSEEEAKARLAEKRREMKEKKEREAEIERQRLLAIQREEEERLRREEEEERRAQEEADRLAEEARRLEEDRLRKAIEEQERREKEQRERDEQIRREKEESERRAKEEAEKKRLELEEKLRREEEERMARKKRIEEIMARTRGAKTAATSAATPQSPSKTNDVVVKNNDSEEVPVVVARTNSPKSFDPMNVDPTTPDLLGDISEDRSVKMSGDEYIETSDVEKGEIDMKISAKNDDARMNQKNSTKLLDLSEFDTLSYRQPDAKAALGSGDNNGHDNDVDQILDLSSANGHTDSDNEAVDRPRPIIAFEENRMTSPKQEVSTADLLS